jgi:hypothetical protein
MGKARQRQLGPREERVAGRIEAVSNRRKDAPSWSSGNSLVTWNIVSLAGSMQWIPADPEGMRKSY